jgi:hypothetical protein
MNEFAVRSTFCLIDVNPSKFTVFLAAQFDCHYISNNEVRVFEGVNQRYILSTFVNVTVYPHYNRLIKFFSSWDLWFI